MASRDAAVSLFAVFRDEPVDRIAALLAALARQDYEGPIELVVALPPWDQPAARAVVARWTRGNVLVVDNPTGERSPGLNRALDHVTGEFAIRVDARSVPPSDYVRRCVTRLAADPSVGVVGGVQSVHVDPRATVAARGIGRALRNRWLLGNAAYRDRGAHGSVDTVYLGAFRTAEVAKMRYDERLTANEDFDLCARYRRAGMQVWLEPGLHVAYEPRTQFDAVYRQYRDFGKSKVRYWRVTGGRPAARQRWAIAGGAGAVILGLVGLRRPVILGLGAATIVATQLATDRASDPGPERLATRIAAVPAHVMIEAGWLTGIALGLMEHARPAGGPDVR